MYRFFASIARLLSPAQAAPRPAGVARRLLESAGARAGQSPHEAQALRESAYAFLRVVR